MAKRKVPPVEWTGAPDFDSQVPYRRIYRAKLGAPLQGVILSEEVVGVYVHWLAGRDQPHLADADNCPGCLAGHRQIRWKGYLECMQPVTGVCFLAEISEGAAEGCPELRRAGQPLRGRSLRLDRAGKTPTCRVVATIGTLRHEIALPQPCDVRRVLEALWFGRLKRKPDEDLEEKDNEGTL